MMKCFDKVRFMGSVDPKMVGGTVPFPIFPIKAILFVFPASVTCMCISVSRVFRIKKQWEAVHARRRTEATPPFALCRT